MTTKQRTGQLIREVSIRPDQIQEAKRMAAKMEKDMKAKNNGIVRGSITNGEKLIYGCLAEIIFAEAMGVPLNNTPHYDLIFRNVKIDVKATVCTSPPKPYYEAHVADYNTEQECDVYVFMRIEEDLSKKDPKAWILGKKKKSEFYKEAIFRKEGELDPDSPRRKFPFPADCYNLKISKLMPIIYPERDEAMLEAYAKYLLMPTCKFTDPSSEGSIIYRKGYVEITGRGFDSPDPHRHYTLEEFQEKMNGDAEFKEFCEKLELSK